MSSYSENLDFFKKIPTFAPDSILGLQVEFQKDSRINKVDLSIGVYIDSIKKIVFGSPVVKSAEKELLTKECNKKYLGISGDVNFISNMKSFVFGNAVEHRNILGVQTLGGTGALSLGADLFNGAKVSNEVYISKETWDNHLRIFSQVGLKIRIYPYYDFNSKKIDFDGLVNVLSKATKGSLVLLHGCCHNPTGTDFSMDQWGDLLEIFQDRSLIPFFDFAYQGFASGFEEDRAPLELFVNKLNLVFVASTLSKNFSLYGERIGFFGVFDKEETNLKKISSFLEERIRGIYSSPSRRGAVIFNTIIENSDLWEDWKKELTELRMGLNNKRKLFITALRNKYGEFFDFIGSQVGFFGYPSFSSQQINFLKQTKAVYVGPGGRFNLAGVQLDNLDYLVECFGLAHAL